MKNKLLTNYKEIQEILGNTYTNVISIYNDKFGIINAILERRELEKYGLKMFQCLSCNTKDLFGLSREVSSGGLGIDTTSQRALIGCLAEALERYSMSLIPPNDLIFDGLDNINEKHKFLDFYTYSDEQYTNINFANPKREKIY